MRKRQGMPHLKKLSHYTEEHTPKKLKYNDLNGDSIHSTSIYSSSA